MEGHYDTLYDEKLNELSTKITPFLLSLLHSDDEILDDTEEEITGLPDPLDTVLHDPPVTPEDKLMSNWFCFVQTEDGKVVIVQHPTSEVTEVVNFKKGIAAAFQSNFKGTTDEEEQDTMSQHRSTYR